MPTFFFAMLVQEWHTPEADPGYQVMGDALKRKCLGISCEKSRFYAKKIIFFPILGGAHAGCAPPSGSAPAHKNYGHEFIFN